MKSLIAAANSIENPYTVPPVVPPTQPTEPLPESKSSDTMDREIHEIKKRSKRFTIKLFPTDVDKWSARKMEAEAAARVQAAATQVQNAAQVVTGQVPSESDTKTDTEIHIEHSRNMTLEFTPEIKLFINADFGSTSFEVKKENYVCLSSSLLVDKGEKTNHLKSYMVNFDILALSNTKHRSCFRCGPHPVDGNIWPIPNFLMFGNLKKNANFNLTPTAAHMDVEVKIDLFFQSLKRRGENSTPKAKRRRITDVASDMLKNKTFSDFTIICGGRDIACHKGFLASSSGVICRMLEAQNVDYMTVDDVEFGTMGTLLKYMYTRNCGQPNVNIPRNLGPIPMIVDSSDSDNGLEFEEGELSSDTVSQVEPMIRSDCEKLFIAGAKYEVEDLCVECMDLIMSKVETNPLLTISCLRLTEEYQTLGFMSKYEKDVLNLLRQNYEDIRECVEFKKLLASSVMLRGLVHTL